MSRKPGQKYTPAPPIIKGQEPEQKGRPYDPAIMDEICMRIARADKSLISICKELKISINIVYAWLRTVQEARDCYARARHDQADSKYEQVSEIIEKIEKKILDPNAARVMIDAIKWQAAHLRPQVYGDRVAVDHSVAGLEDALREIDKLDGKRHGETGDQPRNY